MAKARKRSPQMRSITEKLRGRGQNRGVGTHVRRITHAGTGRRVSQANARTAKGRLRAGLILHMAGGRKQLTAGGGGG